MLNINIVKKYFSKENLEYVKLFLKVILGIGAVIVLFHEGYSFLSNKSHEKEIYWDTEYSKIWSNEGCIDCDIPDVYFDLSLKSEDGKIFGQYVSESLFDHHPLQNWLLVKGHRNGNSAEVILYDVVGGKHVHFAEVELKLNDFLEWDLINGAPFFANKSKLFIIKEEHMAEPENNMQPFLNAAEKLKKEKK
jgi:hypothetical protein